MSNDVHAPVPPSGLAQIIQCPGSWKMCQAHPRDATIPEAAEGDAAHWVNTQYTAGVYPQVGSIAPNGVPVTQEMLEGAELWCDTVGTPQHVEERLPPSEYLGPDNWGTPDAWSYHPVQIPNTQIIGGRIKLSDYKFGHRYVDVYKKRIQHQSS